MKNISKLLSLLLVAAVVLVTFAACGKSNEPTVEKEPVASESSPKAEKGVAEAAADVEGLDLVFGFWGSSGEDKAFGKAIEDISQRVPGVAGVTLQQYPTVADFYQKLPGEIAAGTAPDIINVTNEQHIILLRDGLLLPLDEYQLDLSEYSTTAVDVWQYEGQQYGIPTTSAPSTFAVNDDLWNAADLGDYPTTWDEVYEAAKVLTTDDVAGVCIDIGNIFHPTQYMNSFGGGWKDGTAINSPENVKGLEFIFKMFEEGLAVTAKDAGMSWDGEVFAAEKAAMSTGGTWYVGAMAESAPDLNYSFIPMPGGDGHKGATLHSYAYAVVKDTPSPELAAQVIYEMSDADYQRVNAEITGARPSRTSVLPDFLALNPELSVLSEYEDTATGFGYPADAAFETDFLQALEANIYGGDTTPAQEILDTLADKYGV